MLTDTLLMVRPAAFGFNEQTAASNGFQHTAPVTNVSREALTEFDRAVDTLQAAGIRLLVLEDSPEPVKPDAIFPNNWFSTHPDGTLILYPMATPNRQTEVRTDWLDRLPAMQLQVPSRVVDLRGTAAPGQYLEGTGSLILDPAHRQLFLNRSLRSDPALAARVAEQLGYTVCCFDAFDADGAPVYHTNVLLAIAPEVVICCTGVIPEGEEKQALLAALKKGDRALLEIRPEQMLQFAGNVLFVRNRQGQKRGIISRTGWESLDREQQELFSRHYLPVLLDIPVIEQIGGGSARCMLAELFFPETA